MSMGVRRTRRKAAGRNRPAIVSIRVSGRVRTDTRVPYALAMADRRIDRQAWADVVGELLADETGGNKSQLARLVGVEYKTINRWLRSEVDVSEESVRGVARALGRSPISLLVAVGYYSAEEVASPTSPLAVIDYDPEIDTVRKSGLPPRIQIAIIHRIMELRRMDEERRAQVIQMMIEQAKGA